MFCFSNVLPFILRLCKKGDLPNGKASYFIIDWGYRIIFYIVDTLSS